MNDFFLHGVCHVFLYNLFYFDFVTIRKVVKETGGPVENHQPVVSH